MLDRIEGFRGAGVFVLHWFSGGNRNVDRAVKLGCWFSVGPAMLKGARGRALVARMPPERVLTESDGPFARLDGAAILPWQVDVAVGALSQAWSLPQATVDEMLVANLHRLLVDGIDAGTAG